MDKDMKEKILIACTALGAGLAIGAGAMYAMSSSCSIPVSASAMGTCRDDDDDEEDGDDRPVLRDEPAPVGGGTELELKARIGCLERKILELQEAASSKMTKSFSSCASISSFYSLSSSDEEDFFDVEDELSGEDDDDDEHDQEPGDDEEEPADGSGRRRRRRADNRAAVFVEVDDLFDNGADEAAFRRLLDIRAEFEDDANWAWRMSKACHRRSTLEHAARPGSDAEKSLIYEGLEYAERALQLDAMCADAHKWFAINVGSRGKFVSIKEKIRDGFVFKEHLEQAVTLKPLDYVLYHLLGRFCYEVSQLSVWERSIASTLFASPPSSTFEETLAFFERADALNPNPPGWKENKLFRAKTLILLRRYMEAADVLEAARAIPTKPQESVMQEEVEKLWSKYSKYRR